MPDVLAAARSILSDWNSGKIKYCTHPPKNEQNQVHISASIVHEGAKEFDVNNFDIAMETDILNNFHVKPDEVMELATGVPVDLAENSDEKAEISSSKVILEEEIAITRKVDRKSSGGRLNVKEFNAKTDPTMQLTGISSLFARFILFKINLTPLY